LNPEIDIPEKFITFDLDGQIKGVDDKAADPLERGKKTIEILRLDRGKLEQNRQEILNSFINNFNIIIEGYNFGLVNKNSMEYFIKNECQKLLKIQKPYEEYSLWGKFLNDNFRTLIVNKFPEKFQKIIEKIYDGL